MGKAGRWLKSVLTGRKDGSGGKKAPQQQDGDATPLPAASSPREKKRWSFRRAATPAAAQQQHQGKPAAALSPLSSLDPAAAVLAGVTVPGSEHDGLGQSDHAVAMAVAAAAADAAVMAAAEAVAAMARMSAEEESDVLAIFAVEAAAAARIQATFRGYLARKALCALRGLVKLQALIRGQLVRRQATATLRRMQALVDAQSRLRAQRARMVEADHGAAAAAAAAYQRRSPQHPRRRSSYEMDRSGEEHVRIVEVDAGDPARRWRSSCSAAATESRERRLAEYYCYGGGGEQCSPAPSSAAFGAELSPQRAYSGHFDDAFAFADHAAAAAGSSPHVPPSYMANTESSRAKARSQSAPRQRTDGAAAAAAALERQPSRRRGAPRKTMQRSSSHIGVPAAAGACGYGYGYGYGYSYGYQQQQQNPWAGVRLDRSSASLVGSECGSTSSVLTAATVGYCRSLVGFEVHRGRY
ncbi:uncharacterized protein LOC120687629 [Panicum virgatum]|uniref:DUF4005 domain-containing protein n=1 Tax=Panicum virgatum TaxID=38727 RepID=A0A8T0MLH2_PANVG|nr:uncharacterized protein LOC120687629 [Panicum virgatum]KAG2538007.1 hypothetical protein PVAP13_9NG315700 [Panicum virgatum]